MFSKTSGHKSNSSNSALFQDNEGANFIQPKLNIGEAGDRYEVEADKAADNIVARSQNQNPPFIAPPVSIQKQSEEDIQQQGTEEGVQLKPLMESITSGIQLKRETQPHNLPASSIQLKKDEENELKKVQKKSEFIQRKCPACEVEDTLQRKEEGEFDSSTEASTESALNSSKGSGSPLSDNVRTEMESGFGADFSGVRIHNDSSAVQMSQDLGAQAFTHGNDIYFNEGKYNPSSQEGKHLLAHELTHTIQQGKSPELSKKSIIQRSLSVSKIQSALRGHVSGLITEAPIPGDAPRGSGKGFNKVGKADLYTDTSNAVSGLRGIAKEPISDGQHAGKTKYVYGNMAGSPQTGDLQGPYVYSPTLPQSYARFAVDDRGNSEHYSGASTFQGNFPSSVAIGEIKSNSPLDNPLEGPNQVERYKAGLRRFAITAKRDFNQQVQVPNVSNLSGMNIPARLDYDQFDSQKHQTKNAVTVPTADGEKRLWLAEAGSSGVYIYVPFPKYIDFSTDARIAHDTMRFLRTNVLQQFNNLKQNRSSTNLNRKPLEKGEVKSTSKNEEAKNESKPQVQNKDQKPKIQRKKADTDWGNARKQFFEARDTWNDTWATKYKKTELADDFLKEKVKFEKQLGKESETKAFRKDAKDYKKIVFWSGMKGKAVAELRFLLGEKFDVIADKVESLKERTKAAKGKAGKLKPSFSVGWKAKIVKILLEGFKVGFEQFMEESFAVFAGCINAVISKFEEQMKGELLDEEAEAKLSELQQQVETLIQELQAKYEEQIKDYEDILEKMNDSAFYTSLIADAVNLIRVGVQVVSCVSPPALGCLWGLVAQVGVELGLNLVAGTQWFEDEFMKPMVKKLIDDFLKDDMLTFTNMLFTEAGMGAYIKGVAACTPRDKDAMSGWSLYQGPGGNLIPPGQYKSHANQWEAENKGELMQDVMNASSGNLSEDEIEEFLRQAKDLSPEAFKEGVTSILDLNIIEGDEDGDGARVVNGDEATTDKAEGAGEAGSVIIQNASFDHTKGSQVKLILGATSTEGDSFVMVNVKAVVLNRYYLNYDLERVSDRSQATDLEIVYEVQDNYVFQFDQITGILPKGTSLRGILEF